MFALVKAEMQMTVFISRPDAWYDVNIGATFTLHFDLTVAFMDGLDTGDRGLCVFIMNSKLLLGKWLLWTWGWTPDIVWI